MVKKILVFNVGSSTIKYSIYNDNKRIKEGLYDKLNKKEDYINAFDKIYKKFKNEKIDLIIHRVVHGGDEKKPVRISSKIKKKIKFFSEFAPLHNEKELLVINLAEKFKKPQYAVFDTSFFVNLPEIAKIYPIPLELSKKYQIKKYGFHGLSHEAVSRGLKGKTITIHLGQGASMTAVKNGKAIDTSMGLTPLEGLMMCTRSGTIDPGLVIFLNKKGYNTDKILNSESGFKGLTGYSDFRDILKNLKNKKVKLAYDIFVYHIIEYIGAYSAVLDGLNNLVFTGAIGQNAIKLREDVCKHLDFLGIKLDDYKNQKNDVVCFCPRFLDARELHTKMCGFQNSRHNRNQELISSKSSKVKVYVRNADEDKIMIREVLKK